MTCGCSNFIPPVSKNREEKRGGKRSEETKGEEEEGVCNLNELFV
jgi:hypothetical protein